MTIGILTAMQEEGDIIISHYGLEKIFSLKNIHFYQGNFGNNHIILAVSGVGKIQSAIATSLLIEKFGSQKLINIGIVGNLAGEKYKIGQVLLPEIFYQHDMVLPFDGEHLYYAKKEIKILQPSIDNIKAGGICITGDAFISDENILAALQAKFGADIVEMEAFSFLSVAREFGILDSCYVIKAVSDGANNEALDAHMNNLGFAMQNAFLALEKLVKNI